VAGPAPATRLAVNASAAWADTTPIDDPPVGAGPGPVAR